MDIFSPNLKTYPKGLTTKKCQQNTNEENDRKPSTMEQYRHHADQEESHGLRF